MHAVLEGAGGYVRDLKGNNLVYNELKTKTGVIATDSKERMSLTIKRLNGFELNS